MKIEMIHNEIPLPLVQIDLVLSKIYSSVRPQAKIIPLEEALEWYEIRELDEWEWRENPFDKYMDLDLDKVEIELSSDEWDCVSKLSDEKDLDKFEVLQNVMKNWFEVACIYLTRLENKRAFMKYPIKKDLAFELASVFELEYQESLKHGKKEETEKE